ncbi:MAG: glycosyltransferase family 39 protein [bacterium]
MPAPIFTVEAVTASAVLLASAWPLTRAGKAIVADCRTHGRWLSLALGGVALTALALRFFAVTPTLLSHEPSVHHYLDRLLHPLGPEAAWHPFHGMGGYVLHAGITRVFGDSLGVIWTTNRLFDALTPLLCYLLARRLFDSPLAGVLAAALLAVFPPQLRVAASTQLLSLTVFFAAAAYCAVLDALERPGRWSYLAAAVALAAAMQLRAEVATHLFFCGLLILMRVRGEAWPRLDRWFFGACGLLVVLCILRLLSSLQTTENPEGLFRLRFFLETLLSRRHLYINPELVSPVYPLLTLLGLVGLAMQRRWRLLLFLAIALAAGWVFYLNQFTFDVYEALRFQAHAWFLLIAVAGFGLSWLATISRQTALRVGICALGLAAATGSLITAWPLLTQHTATAQNVTFFASHLHRVPTACELYLLRPRHKGKKRPYGPGIHPRWALKSRAGKTRSFPEQLQTGPQPGCRVAYLGVGCASRYPSDDPAFVDKVRQDYKRRVGPPLYVHVERWRAGLDRQPPPPRPECQWLRRHFQLEPLVTTTIHPGRRTYIWTPKKKLTVGFYRLRARPTKPR